MMSQKKLIPKKRFKGYFDNWEVYKLEDLSEIRTGKAFKSTNFKRNGEYLVVTNKNIQDQMYKIESKGDRINISDESILRNYLLTGENILVTMDGVNIGKVGKYSNNEGVLAQRVGRVNSEQIEFIYQITSNNKFLTEMNKLSVGNAIKHISLKQIAEYTFMAPKYNSEQQKLGQFFKHLDDMIALHQRKIDKTKALKSAYLAEMFPAEGERVPKRRFSGFTDEWEIKKLGEIGQTFNGLSGKTKKDFGIGDAEFVTYLNVFNNPISNTNITENVEIDLKQNEVKYGDVLFTTSSETPHEVGMSSVWFDNRPNVYLNSFCFGYRINISINYLFIAYLFRSNIMRKQMEILAQGISRYNISKNKVMEIAILLPGSEEQKKIGKFFKNLDDIITNHERKLEKLKATKQAYLNEMFV
ncbi:restriction endonuclease subunit S [Sporosarcina sp. Marseille-Q4063]|uniref:restriction endonuclease subunit S n=1 Tax=Sporosarcina sp. Marseille-Q4063 TaxID=2810514 RepID=UPI001BAEC647|nr:restriction endonuclease subunit S [Sporosarcina sp. Marseille-Q4063]QUW23062.1 restriction endonuclease subunit S [Sporosarcina sp. Marseille-Q4063]